MYKELLQSVEGIEIYPLVSLFIFIAFSIGIVIWVVKLDKSYVREMETLPLEADENLEKLSGQKRLFEK